MPAIKFFDGEKAEAIPATATADGSVLVIRKVDGTVIDHWTISDIKFDPNHLDRRFLMIPHEPRARIQIIDLELIKQLPHLKIASYHLWFESPRFIIGGVVLIISFGVLVFLASKPISHWMAQRISLETEKKYAAQLNYDRIFEICPVSIAEKDLTLKLEKLSSKNKEFQELISNVRTIHMIQPNAFTLPGGKIFITDSLVQKSESYEALLGVIAHEAGHFKNRHVLQGLIRGSFLTLGLNFLTGDFSQYVLIDPNSLIKILGLKFDRDLEHEADEYAVQILKSIDVGTDGLSHFFQFMQTDSKIKVPEFISTHPSDDARIEYLSKFKNNRPVTLLPEDTKLYSCRKL